MIFVKQIKRQAMKNSSVNEKIDEICRGNALLTRFNVASTIRNYCFQGYSIEEAFYKLEKETSEMMCSLKNETMKKDLVLAECLLTFPDENDMFSCCQNEIEPCDVFIYHRGQCYYVDYLNHDKGYFKTIEPKVFKNK